MTSACILASLVFTFGCAGGKGESKNTVTGKVTLNGKAVDGTVTFVGADKQESSSPIGPGGSYVILDPPLGKVDIVIKGGLATPPAKTSTATKAPTPDTGTTKLSGVAPPAKYANRGHLIYDVKEGKHTHDIALTP